MSGEVEAELAALSQGASELNNISSGFDEISQAAGTSTQLTPIAFGILCQFFTPVANVLQGIASEAISSTATAFQKTGAAVGACHSDFTQVDEEAAHRYSQLGGKLS